MKGVYIIYYEVCIIYYEGSVYSDVFMKGVYSRLAHRKLGLGDALLSSCLTLGLLLLRL